MGDIAISKIAQNDSNTWNTNYGRWKYVVPLPPESLMWSVGGISVENFLVVGDAWAQVVNRYTKPNCSVLDIGCGCGRTARLLMNNRWITTYIGFDVVAEAVAWCNNFLKPACVQARCDFHHFDLYSGEYNPTGILRASEFHFPCPDASVDVIFAGSLFTHLLEPDSRHYLREIRRSLGTEGTAVVSIHDAVPYGVNYAGTERRIDVAPDYFLEMADDAGLREKDRIPDLAGQLAIVLTR